MENNREQWSSKASFILAAAGSAVGHLPRDHCRS